MIFLIGVSGKIDVHEGGDRTGVCNTFIADFQGQADNLEE